MREAVEAAGAGRAVEAWRAGACGGRADGARGRPEQCARGTWRRPERWRGARWRRPEQGRAMEAAGVGARGGGWPSRARRRRRGVGAWREGVRVLGLDDFGRSPV